MRVGNSGRYGLVISERIYHVEHSVDIQGALKGTKTGGNRDLPYLKADGFLPALLRPCRKRRDDSFLLRCALSTMPFVTVSIGNGS
jgi:hypothetical protein